MKTKDAVFHIKDKEKRRKEKEEGKERGRKGVHTKECSFCFTFLFSEIIVSFALDRDSVIEKEFVSSFQDGRMKIYFLPHLFLAILFSIVLSIFLSVLSFWPASDDEEAAAGATSAAKFL